MIRNKLPRLVLTLILTLMLAVVSGCGGSKGSGSTGPVTDIPLAVGFAKGADVSWLTQMEATGYKFYNDQGVEADLFDILKDHGINAIRLRAWVDPDGGWNGTADVVAKAKRAKEAGMDLMIDFHYSDSWADPGKQYKPKDWLTETTIAGLCQRLKEHTVMVLTALKGEGITPKWVQVGNETDAGMLFGHWDNASNKYISDGGLDLTDLNKHFAEYAQLVTAGSRAVKSVFPESLVIVHLSKGYDNGLYRWNIGGLIAKGAEFDVIGMSLYPSPGNWSSYNSQCLNNISDMVNKYGKPVMICEAGMEYTAAATCKTFLIDLMRKVNLVPGGKGLGVFYWEPQCYGDWPIGDPYRMGAWGNDGRPTEAMDAFLIK